MISKVLSWIIVPVALIWAVVAPSFASLLAFFNSVKNVTDEKTKNYPPHPKIDVQRTFNIKLENIKVREVATGFMNLDLSLADRFVEVFEAHGVHRNEIPRLLPEQYEVTYKDLAHQENVVATLQPQLIDWICGAFGIRREWLERGEPPVYETEEFYDKVRDLLRLLKDLHSRYPYRLRVIAYKDVKELKPVEGQSQHINFLIILPIVVANGEVIHNRYIPTRTRWNWGYQRSRLQFKSIVKLCHDELGLIFEGRILSSEIMKELTSGKVFPKAIVDEGKFLGTTWYPYDYAPIKSGNVCAKETHEAEAVLDYIEERRYMKVFSEE